MKNPPGGMPSSGQLYTKVFIRQNISTIWGKGGVKVAWTDEQENMEVSLNFKTRHHFRLICLLCLYTKLHFCKYPTQEAMESFAFPDEIAIL